MILGATGAKLRPPLVVGVAQLVELLVVVQAVAGSTRRSPLKKGLQIGRFDLGIVLR